MVLKSKLLNEKVMKSAQEILKKTRDNVYVAKKLNAVIAEKYTITAVVKICLILRTVLTTQIKY